MRHFAKTAATKHKDPDHAMYVVRVDQQQVVARNNYRIELDPSSFYPISYK